MNEVVGSGAAAEAEEQVRHDHVRPELLARMAATLGVPVPAVVPPLWHWMFFADWVPPEQIGADGHIRRGGFIPALPAFPRRMWAGSRVRFLQDLRPDDPITRRSTIARVQEKQGGSGALVFVTVRHLVSGPAGPALEEEQDLVFRGTEGAAVKPAAPATDLGPGETLRGGLVPDPVLLFRYSALTGNGHRIHYDADYVRAVEGYPWLIVHGPLQATLLAGLLHDRRLARFSFRGLRPAFAGNPLRLEGRLDGITWTLRSLDGTGAACMAAEAELA